MGATIIFFSFALLRWLGNKWTEKTQNNNRYYHELDLTIELPMDSLDAAILFERAFKTSIQNIDKTSLLIPSGIIAGDSSGKLITEKDQKIGEGVKKYLEANLEMFPKLQNLEQVAYRYSHGGFNEGTHKVHYEFDFYWPGILDLYPKLAKLKSFFWYLITKTGLITNPYVMKDCELIYEVLSHAPSSKVKHLLKELRFIATYKQKLTPERIMYLKIKLINVFIMQWLPKEYMAMEAEIRKNIYPLFSLTVAVLDKKKEDKEEGDGESKRLKKERRLISFLDIFFKRNSELQNNNRSRSAY